MTLRPLLLAVILAVGLAPDAALAEAEQPPAAEASQLVGGTVQVDAQGAVSQYTIEHRELLPDAVIALLDSTIAQWRFEPVLDGEGHPVAARTDMHVLVVLTPRGKEQFELSLRGATFGDASPTRHRPIALDRLQPPQYPRGAAMLGATGTVYLLVKIGRDGQVEQAVDEQVNLTGASHPRDRANLRARFAEAAIRGARRWRFTPPSEGPSADAPNWTVRVPVAFSMAGAPTPAGQWQVYVPGPRRAAPWQSRDEGAHFSPDALPPGNAHVAGTGLRLRESAPGS